MNQRIATICPQPRSLDNMEREKFHPAAPEKKNGHELWRQGASEEWHLRANFRILERPSNRTWWTGGLSAAVRCSRSVSDRDVEVRTGSVLIILSTLTNIFWTSTRICSWRSSALKKSNMWEEDESFWRSLPKNVFCQVWSRVRVLVNFAALFSAQLKEQ